MASAVTQQSSTPAPAVKAEAGVVRFHTARDWLDALGNVPLERILFDPPPGHATEADVLRLHDHADRLCELIDGTLVEKTVGQIESIIAARIIYFLNLIVIPNKVGIVSGEAGMIRMPSGQVRVPDVAFFSFARLPGGRVPTAAVPAIVPDLAVEVLSQSNTSREMEIKLAEYFQAGTRMVWYIHVDRRTIDVYRAVDQVQSLTSGDRLSAGEVLPGFHVAVSDIFDVEWPGA